MKHVSHPIVGDTKHGRGEHNKLFREKFNCHRLLLHAGKMVFVHPVSKKELIIIASLEQVFEDLFKIFGWNKWLA